MQSAERKPDPWIRFFGAVLILTSVAAPALAGCPETREARPLPRPEIPDDLTVDPPIDTRDACASWRWVAEQRDVHTPCPEPAPARGLSWRVRPLFEAEPGDDLPAILRPYCLYEVASGDERARRALQRNLARLARSRAFEGPPVASCAAVRGEARSASLPTPNLPTKSPEVWNRLEGYFLAQAGALNGASPSATVAPAGDSPDVRLVLIDTQPDDPGALGTGRSDHGLALGLLARRLLCDEEADTECALRPRSRLALPIYDFSAEDPRDTRMDDSGGYFGTIDQLAQAVWQEARAHDPETERRVLNLSLGWVGERFGGLEPAVGDMPVPVRSLYHAFEVASCRGILAVAAAGNRVGGPEIESGPLLPAAWQSRPAPSAARCREVLRGADRAEEGEEPREEGRRPRSSARDEPASTEPLVHAAGGVYADDQPLINARPASEPPLVAYADHAVVSGTRADQRPTVLTGSSVAAVVVSSAATAVWQRRPELSRAQVMETVRASGRELERPADIYLAPAETSTNTYLAPAPPVHRIDVCRAVAATCRPGEPCPVACEPPPVGLELRSTDAGASDIRRLSRELAGHDFCDNEILYVAPDQGMPPVPCPLQQRFSIWARPWTGPQPQNNPCLGCDIQPPPDEEGNYTSTATKSGTDSGWVLRILVDPAWKGGPLEEVILRIGRKHFALDAGKLHAGDEMRIGGIDPTLLTDTTGRRLAVALHFLSADGSIESPVFVGCTNQLDAGGPQCS